MGDRLHFGSLEEAERQRLLAAAKAAAEGVSVQASSSAMGSAAIQAAIKAGNVNIAEAGRTEVMELTDTSREAQERQALLLRKLEAEKRKRLLVVPTNPAEVVATLRSLGQPITLFGETVADRRERLREFLATQEVDRYLEGGAAAGVGAGAGAGAGEAAPAAEGLLGAAPPSALDIASVPLPSKAEGAAAAEGKAPPSQAAAEAAAEKERRAAELFYTVGAPELVEARKTIAAFSFQHAAARLARLRQRQELLSQRKADETPEAAALQQRVGEAYDRMRRLGIHQSQLGDDRPLAAIEVSPGAHYVATGSWTNACKVWDLQQGKGALKELCTLRGHTERVSSIAWMPIPVPDNGGGDGSGDAMEVDGGAAAPPAGGYTLASCAVDGTARLWHVSGDGAEGRELHCLRGHAARLALCAFHPTGRFLGTTSWDHTWRLWDVETGQELLLQDGHFKETHAIAFQGDGALVATGDYAGIGHVWDLRSGKSIYQLMGHTQKILCAAWHPNGYQVATGGSENVVKVWDVRKKQNIYTLPAHSGLISSVKYSPGDGEFLATASFDGQAKIWGTRDFRLLKTLEGHEGRVVGIDFLPDGQRLVTASHDRTFKLWGDMREF